MTAAVMFYGVVVGLLIVPAALLADWAAALRRSPRRWGWAWALLVTIALPVIAPWRAAADGAAPIADAAAGPTGAGVSVAWTVVASGVSNTFSALTSARALVEPWAAAVWLVASAGVAFVYAAGHLVLARRRRQWTHAIVQDCPVMVAVETGPAVVGVASPVVVLPQWAQRLDEASLAVILRHEREHVAARDPWLVHAAGLATMLMPWNPAVWWMAARLRLAVEFDCDARVLGRGTVAPDDVARYGELLLAVAARRDSVVPFAAPALIESSSSLSRRIAAMCASHGRFCRTKMIAAAAGAVLLLVTACRAPVPAGSTEQTERSAPSGPEPTAVRGPALELERGPVTTVPAAPRSAFESADVRRPGPGVTNPRVLRETRPAYTSRAMRAKIQGTVELEALIGADGLVKDVRVTKSLDKEFGLDEEAIKAARAWQFEPAMTDSKPVPIVVTLVLSFAVH